MRRLAYRSTKLDMFPDVFYRVYLTTRKDINYGRFSKRFFTKVEKTVEKDGFMAQSLAAQIQKHTANVRDFSARGDRYKVWQSNDGIVTARAATLLMMNSADCVPIFLYSPDVNAVGIVHAGYKGVLKNISRKAVRMFKLKYKADPGKIIVWLGPAIDKCCYEVSGKGRKIVEKFKSDFGNSVFRKDKDSLYLDLRTGIIAQLKASGVRSSNIERSKACTACSKNLPSHFREKETRRHVLVAMIGKKIVLPSKAECLALLKKYKLTQGMIRHTKKVEKLAVYLAGKLQAAGLDVNIDLLNRAALLHDISKAEAVTKGGDHTRMGKGVIKSLGYPAVAEIVSKHGTRTVCQAGMKPATLEERILYYVDKRVKHDKVVSLNDRFTDLEARYPREKNFREAFRESQRIERELFKRLNISPSSLNRL